MSKSPYLLKKRGKFWQFRLAGEKTFHSVNSIAKQMGYVQKITAKSKAETIVIRYLQERKKGTVNIHDITLKKYVDKIHFFIAGKCKWEKRQCKIGKKISPDWLKQKRAHLENHILDRFGMTRLLDIDGIEVEDWLLQKELSTQQRKHIKNTFHTVMNEAVREKFIQTNPLAIVDVGTVRVEKQDVLTLEELKKLFPGDNEKLIRIWRNLKNATMFMLMVTSGMRPQEIRALLWKNIVWDIGVWIKQAMKANNQIGSTKNKEERCLYLPSRTFELLKLFREKSAFPADDHFIFYGRNGNTPISRRAMWVIIQKVYMIMFPESQKQITLRSLRHTYRTVVGKAVSLQMIKEQMGHKSDKVSEMYNAATPLERLQQYEPERRKLDEIFS